MGYGHWYRTEDGPEFREELIHCPHCGELVDGDTYQCDNIYCSMGDDDGEECAECGCPVPLGDDYCQDCVRELSDTADLRHGTGEYE